MCYNAVSNIITVISFEIIDMTTEILTLNTNNIIKSYNAGQSILAIAKTIGVDQAVVANIILDSGYKLIKGSVCSPETSEIVSAMYKDGFSQIDISAKTGFSVYTISDVVARNFVKSEIRSRSTQHVMDELRNSGKTEQDVIAAFNSGIGVAGMMDAIGISVAATKTILKKNGIALRNRSQQQFARMASYTKEEIKKLTRNANIASKYRTVSVESLCKRAKTVEKKVDFWQSDSEIILAKMLLERGIETIPQKAIGRYNCDLTSNTVAVEIFGGHWHWHGQHLARTKDRVNYILDQGWDVLMVAVNQSFPLTDEVADYIASYINSRSRNPTRPREYRVIWGAAEFTTSGRLNDENFSIEPPFTSTRDTTNGQYMTIAK